MTTGAEDIFSPKWNLVQPLDLESLVERLGTDSSAFKPEQVRERLDALDDLDLRLGDLNALDLMNDVDARICRHARAVRARFEAVNTVLYESIRSEIVQGGPPHTLLRCLQAAGPGETANLIPGLGYDYRDEVLSDVLQLREPRERRLHPLLEMVFYQPTPVRHILRLLTATALSEADVFVDLGSGLGHVTVLASMLTGVRSIGIEVEAAYVASAQECAQGLRISRVRFICEDARAADLSSGTVFYLYSPFTGSILADVLERLEKASTSRRIKICALGPCTRTLAKAPWLEAIALPDPMQITVFQRRL